MQEIHTGGLSGGSGGGGGGSSGGRIFGDRRLRPQNHHHQAALKCPRCDSLNTKFCYYNNYNLSQPRHFCKNCRRYWTKGGVLRNIPVGGGCRKSKRSSSSSKPKSSKKSAANSHSSSESSTSASTVAAAAASGGGAVFQNFESENTGLEALVEPNKMAELLFSAGEIGGFTTLIGDSPAGPLGLSGCNADATTASFNQLMQNQAAVLDWEVSNSGGVHHEGDQKTTHGLVGGILDPTVTVDDLLQNRGINGGLPSLDWQVGPHESDNGQGLFDLPSTVDHHQSYWSQTTTSHHFHHHHQWSDNCNTTNNDHPLFFP